MKAVIVTGAAPFDDRSGFRIDIEIHDDGGIWLNGGAVIIEDAHWDAVVDAVANARAAFALLARNARQEAPDA